jgi:hypothetical protein
VLKQINDINQRCRIAHLIYTNSVVNVVQAMPAEACTPETLKKACEAVCKIADDVGVLFAAVYGGATPFGGPEDAAPDEGPGDVDVTDHTD